MELQAVRVIKEMGETFVKKHVARSAAALSYYLTISVFPFLICVSAIIGSIHIQESEMFNFLADIIPYDVYSYIVDFLSYMSGYSTELMLIIGLTAMLTSSSAAFRSFLGIMGEIQGKMRYRGVWKGVVSFALSITFLTAIYISGLVILSGQWLMQILETYVEFGDMLALWTWIRFVLSFISLP